MRFVRSMSRREDSSIMEADPREAEAEYDDDYEESSGMGLSSAADDTTQQGDDEYAKDLRNASDDGSAQSAGEDVQAIRDLTEQETLLVRVSKAATVVMLLVAAAGVSAATFLFLRWEEESEFKSNFNTTALTLADDVKDHIDILFQSTADFAKAITREAVVHNQTFPFVTVSNFEVLASQIRDITGAEALFWTPNLAAEQYEDWRNYTFNEQDKELLVSREYYLEQTNRTWEEVGFTSVPISGTILGFNYSIRQYYPVTEPRHSLPIRQTSPPSFDTGVINFDMGDLPYAWHMKTVVDEVQAGVWDRSRDLKDYGDAGTSIADHQHFHEMWIDRDSVTTSQSTEQTENQTNTTANITAHNYYSHPHMFDVQPIRANLSDNAEIAGYLWSIITLDRYLGKLLSNQNSKGVVTLVVKNSCNESFTYELTKTTAKYIGPVDVHESAYADMGLIQPLHTAEASHSSVEGPCSYTLFIYPTASFEQGYKTLLPIYLTVAVASTFGFIMFVFGVFDVFVNKRNSKIVEAAAKSNRIVTSLFPTSVHDRLFGGNGPENGQSPTARAKNRANTMKRHASAMGLSTKSEDNTDPIADLFPETTILFADIAGFTAWSSTREPTQVFILLETIYKAFDDIAKHRRIFKVETVGDCYVAASGLPDPRKDHAVAMARFAHDCVHSMQKLTKQLEVALGPDTTDLNMRVGIHSGPVTAGVLRGERSRFQLFGDTMNTASRMESTGQKGKIQVSQDTADLLIAAGKSHWVSQREEKIVAKGKGELQTFWLVTTKTVASSETGSTTVASSEASEDARTQDVDQQHDERTLRLVQWNVDIFKRLLRRVIAHRGSVGGSKVSPSPTQTTPFDEVTEVITLPTPDEVPQGQDVQPEDVVLGPAVEEQLTTFVSTIAGLYRSNPFHNFEHASHVTMSVVKLLSRIVSPDVIDPDADTLDYAHTIDAYPLTQLACVFSALIHDVDHRGVPNSQLIKEYPELGTVYNNKSVAEQNSVDVAWEMLQDCLFEDLRQAIANTKEEAECFRQLVVNMVLATDIMDKDLKALRNARWDRAFSSKRDSSETDKKVSNRKATIVIEHLIQASDVAHTMQHWHVYRKWNMRLFEEMYEAYVEGRSENDPSDNWYKGEIGFFDFYIIPLAKKLRECGVFGVSSDEYLNYAQHNRNEWEQRGQELVAQMVEDVQRKVHSSSNK